MCGEGRGLNGTLVSEPPRLRDLGERMWSWRQGELVPSGHARALRAMNSAPVLPCTGAAQGQANSHPSMAGEGRVTYLQVCGPAKLLMIQRRAPNPFTRTALSSVGLKNNNNKKV